MGSAGADVPPGLWERWAQLVSAVAGEFAAHRRDPARALGHDFAALELRARRPLPSGGSEWFSAAITPEELMTRDPQEIARSFYAAYHACT